MDLPGNLVNFVKRCQFSEFGLTRFCQKTAVLTLDLDLDLDLMRNSVKRENF